MRDIKFRGKTKDGVWVYGDLVNLDKGCIIITSSLLVIDDSLSKNDRLVYSDEEFAVVIPKQLVNLQE